ncbi:MAG: Isoprenyl transferase [Lentisphaerae bacterium ADurb.BinA184]|nr:MAG: Isoprenyl transferase [Lentisphaerae bacterium ADurb.BinA184]
MTPAPSPSLPTHVAVIMDGNGRWAARHAVPRIEGHRAGAEAVRRTVECCAKHRIRHLTLYAFSTENWRRPQPEVRQLMGLLRQFLDERLEDLQRHGIRLNAIGQLDRLPTAVRRRLDAALAATHTNTKGVLTLALSYGSRAEITAAARTLAQDVLAGRLDIEDVAEYDLAHRLYTADLPDPDLLIRTSGECRLSNFLLWQLSYAELYFCDCLWPDFGEAEFEAALAEFARRQRRFGGR